jgi:hypothetical protein
MMQTQVGQLMKANVAAVPALASRGALEDSPVLQNYYRQQYRDQQTAAHAAEQVIGGMNPEGPDFEHVRYVMTGLRGEQQQASTTPEPVTETGSKPRQSR